jgi:TonB-linked SusC/RagA family outer membrane protein
MKSIMWFVKQRSGLLGLILTCLLFIAASNTYAQNGPTIKVSGTVVDAAKNDPIPGASILIKGTQTGSVTDINGKYSLNVPQGATLLFSYIGYENYEVLVSTQNNIDVSLKAVAQAIDGVVVIGYGTTTKKEITGSIASVKSDQFNKGAYTNPMGLLQGKVAGLTIVNPNGSDPLANPNIILRGTGTLTSGQGPLIIIDGVAGADMKNISPEEIESMDVLKDGAAAAIYGTRGSNGVIIITTKRAKSGASKIEYTGQFSFQVAPRMVKNLSADEFRTAIRQYSDTANILNANTDWYKEVTRSNPFSQKHNLAISGGNENFSHRTNIYIDQADGMLKNNVSNKYLIRTNIAQKAFGDILLLDYNLSYSLRKYKPANYDVFYQAFVRNPTSPVYDPANTNSGGYEFLDEDGNGYYNPVAMLNERTVDGKTIEGAANVRATIKLVRSLKWVNFISIDQADDELLSYKTRYYPSILGQFGEAEISNAKNSSLQYESTLNYTKTIEKHTFQALAGYTYQTLESNSSYMDNSKFDVDLYSYNNIGAGAAIHTNQAYMSSYKESSILISFFGRLMYNYNERYLLAVSLRKEGSSRFGANNKWGWFPAASLGWRINKESFMTNVSWVNDLKLRVGYGVTGNQEFANYQSLIMMASAGQFLYNGQWINSYAPVSNPNPDLRWEKKQEVNAGIDFSILNNRVSGVIDYYYRKSTDLLYTYQVNVPPYIYNSLFTNVGAIGNNGLEISVNAVAVKKPSFNWTTTVTFSKNNNKLIKFTNAEFKSPYIGTGQLYNEFHDLVERLYEGKSIGTFYGPEWLGIDSKGQDFYRNDTTIAKSNKSDTTTIYNEVAIVPIGNAMPFCILGWSNTLTYNNWDLNFSLRAQIGGDVLDTYRLYYENWGVLGKKNIIHTQLDNPEFTGKAQYSSKYIEKATYLKLDNISLGYNVPVRLKYISKVRVNLTAQNVFTITGYKGLDPEVSLSGLAPGMDPMSYYPRSTSVTLGVNVIF